MQDDDFDDKIETTAAAGNAGANVPAVAKADTPTVPPGHKLVDQPWRIMSIGLRQWAHGF